MGGVAPSGVCFPLVLSSAVTSASGFLTLGKGSSLPLQPLVTVTTRSEPALGSLSFPEMVSLVPALILERGKCSRHRDWVREVELPVTGSVTRGSQHPQPWPSGLWGQLGSI